jgi:hypothetical protein
MSALPFPRKVTNALHWIVTILEHEAIPYQLLGGLAARFYGATRAINDIDLDIGEKDFPKIIERTREYVHFRPEVVISSEWMVLMVSLIYEEQLIEITNGDFQKIYDDESSEWKVFRYDLHDVVCVPWQHRTLRLMTPEKMALYKKLLHGPNQAHDIEAIESYIRRNAGSKYPKCVL